MENGWNLFSGGRGQNGNCTNLAWDIWELGTSRYDWSTGTTTTSHALFNQLATTATNAAPATASTSATRPGASEVHALMYAHHGSNAHHHHPSSSAALYVGGGAHYHPDPHLMCLKLGKRHYFEDATCPGERHVAEGLSVAKRGKQYYSGDGGGGGGGVGPSTSAAVTVAIPAAVPRCQVEGCHVALVNAKDYHRRHKVCEMHSKAPKVVVLGLEQRFCQQCSRFHVVSEFDDSKRSCRRRLAGHNERRRKNSHDHFVARNPSQENTLMAGRFPCISTPTGRALSLLSSPPDLSLSSRCSAALRELIAENRAAILARQFIVEDSNRHQNESSNPLLPHQHQMFAGSNGWDRFDEAGTSVTLDLMQAPSSAFGFLSMSGKSREEEECSELWSSLGGTHVV